MVIGNEDRQDRLPAAVGVICASDTNDVETRVLSPQEQQEINNVVQQFTTIQNTQITNIENVINIINNVTNTTPPQNETGTTPPPTGGGGGGGLPEPQVPGGIPENATAAEDITPPVVSIPIANVAAENQEGILLPYEATAEDNVDGAATLDRNNILIQDNVGGAITISCIPPSGSIFPIGTHTIECTAVDQAGNVGTESSTFSVQLLADPGAPGGTTGGTPLPPRERLEGAPAPPPTEEEGAAAPPVEEEEQAPPPAAEGDEGAAASPPANEEGG
jgi:hypothetical protein